MTEPRPPDSLQKLERRFFDRDPALVARELIGATLLRVTDSGMRLGGRITETEAYLASEDPASHSSRGPTRRNRSMFDRPGTLYVYSIHAKFCMNVATQPEGVGSAVLIRAIEPLWGLDEMRRARGHDDPLRLTRGPAMLCQALGITTRDDGIDLIDCLWLGIHLERDLGQTRTATAARIGVSGRVGIRRGCELPLRYFAADNAHVSRRKSGDIKTKKPAKAGDEP